MVECALKAASLATVPLMPVALLQGAYVAVRMPRLPGADGLTTGLEGGAGPPVRLLVCGESTVAGVGAATHGEALTGQVARALALLLARPVQWRALGRIGVTAAEACQKLLCNLPDDTYELAVIALGVNDVLRLHSPHQWTRGLRRCIAQLRREVGPCPVVLASVPPLGRFPALPQPLRGVLGLRALELDRAAQRLAHSMPQVAHATVDLPADPSLFCADRFHPSPRGYAVWAQHLAAVAARQLPATSAAVA